MKKYTLEGKTPVATEDLIEWAQWFEKANRNVNNTTIGDAIISTVFLGIDHQFGDGVPILFETMIFGGDHDGFQERYATWDEAVEGHEIARKMVAK